MITSFSSFVSARSTALQSDWQGGFDLDKIEIARNSYGLDQTKFLINEETKKETTLDWCVIKFPNAIEWTRFQEFYKQKPHDLGLLGTVHVVHQVAIFYLKGSQEYAEGIFDLQCSTKFCLRMFRKLPQNIGLTSFQSESVPYLTGGTCSAMTFSFLARCMRLIFLENAPASFSIETVMKTHSKSGIFFRNVQAAMNQLVVTDPLMNEEVAQLAKIQALAGLYFLRVKAITGFLPFDSFLEGDAGDLNNNVFDSLIDGIYLIRSIALNPTKQSREDYGHSVGLICKDNEAYHYDPNVGVLKPIQTISKLMKASLLSAHCKFKFDGYRVYRLLPSTELFRGLQT